MDATELLAAVTARTPVDEREAESIERVVVELARLERPFDEHADPVHVTGSAIVVHRDRGVVLHLHKRMGRWFQPGGHLDPGESPADAALREAVEETGLAALRHPFDGPRLVHVDAHDGPKGHFHLDVRYLIEAPTPDDPTPPPGESPDCRWFGWEEAIAVADAGLVGALEVLRTDRPR
jgi:8-oxo-dGTP pyrophosphatase MutT (NUDIX family)